MPKASYSKIQKTPGYMIEVFKITHGIYDSDVSFKLSYHSGSITRGNTQTSQSQISL